MAPIRYGEAQKDGTASLERLPWDAQDALLATHQQRTSWSSSAEASRHQAAPGMQTLTSIPEGQTSAPAESTDQNVQTAEPASSTSDSQEWNAWCDFQESASSMLLSFVKPESFIFESPARLAALTSNHACLSIGS